MGAIDLDFSEAVFQPGITDVSVRAVMGAVSITVPPHLQVECDGRSILGHFEAMDVRPRESEPDAPVLRISGVAIMGAVEISTRPTGEGGEVAKPA